MALKGRMGLVAHLMQQDDINKDSLPQESTNIIEQENKPLVATKESRLRPVSERVKEVDPLKCKPWKFADRPEDEAGHSSELAESFLSNEQLSPVIVRELDHLDPDYPVIEYEIIAGSVRWRAAKKAGVMLKAFVRDLTDKEALNVMLIENEQRKGISEFSRALQISRVWDSGMFASKVDLANAHKMDASKVSRYLKVAEHKDALLEIFADEIKTIGLRQLYQTISGEEGDGMPKQPKPATKPKVDGFAFSFNKQGITTIRYPAKISEDKLEKIKAIIESPEEN
ncbi:MAG: ParB/RepB/Spo0J family partition protein [Proteobacteria bacterium]|nr:ParB/RepB/Spo0J family partition protein [Pseudomonadota bacterium]